MKKIIRNLKLSVVLIYPFIAECIVLKIFLINAPFINNYIIYISTLLSISFTITFIYFYTYGPLLHELGHYYTANKFHKTSAKIDYILYPFKERIHIGRISLGRERRKKINGNMQPDNNFQPYSSKEICKIAKAGYRWSIAGSVIYLIAHIFILQPLFIRNGISVIEAKELTISIVIINVCLITINYLTYKFGKPKTTWSDRDIWHDPEGFKKFCQSKLPHT